MQNPCVSMPFVITKGSYMKQTEMHGLLILHIQTLKSCIEASSHNESVYTWMLMMCFLFQ